MKSLSVPILMYHSIASHADRKFREFTVSSQLFAEHINYLAEHHYVPITVTQLARAINMPAPELPERPVVLTFDDGYVDFYTNALPMLKHYGFVATLYITTAFVGDLGKGQKGQGALAHPMLTWEQIVEIDASRIECGSHSHTHAQLDTLPEVAARSEIVKSKQMLEDRLGHSVLSFAYPYGYYTRTVQQLVRTAGYTSACAVRFTRSSTRDDPFALKRLIVTNNTRRNEFAALLNGRGSSWTTMWRQARTSVWKIVRHSTSGISRTISKKGI